jgi:phage internal scaffolding protein
MSKVVKHFRDDCGVVRDVGEIWFDRAGNECHFRDDGKIYCRTVNNDPTMTIQSEKDACDVNKIVEKCRRTGLMTNVRKDEPRYGDFSSAVDYHDCVFRAQQAQDSFMELSASVRSRFENDPGKLIDFLADPNNREEAVKLGLVASPSVVLEPVKDEVPPSKEGG